METYLDLTKGLHTDFETRDQPTGTYRHLKNAIRQLSGSIENEKGTVLRKQFTSTSRRIVGSYVLDSESIIFSVDAANLSEIGVLDYSNQYTIITNDPSLAFNLSTIISAEGKRNYKGERVIYFAGKSLPMRVLNLDRVPTTNFDDNTKLVLTADMPQTRLTSVTDGGTLPTGIYQFGTRLLTKSSNATSVSLLTNAITITDDGVDNRDLYDGAPPQSPSNKAINLNISSVDTDYEFIEILAVTYIGTANVLKTDIIARIPIQGRTSIDFTYSNTSQLLENLDITALAADNIGYDSAEFIIQKDGILVLGGLTSSVIDYNFQSAANNITIKYTIKEEIWNEDVTIANGVDVGTIYSVGNDYKNPLTSIEFKSYQRGEVYSFAIVPIFKNWNAANAYHIPAPVGYNPGNVPFFETTADITTKALGTYNSLEIYPTNKDYPDTQNRVRHHRMPSLQQEPHVQARNGTTYIRMLGIRVDLTSFLSAIPTTVKKEIIGYVIVKQKRDDTNKSILAQGIATGHQEYAGGNYTSMAFAQFPEHSLNTVADYSMVAFYSPETVITKSLMSSGTVIKPVLEMSGDSHLVASQLSGDNSFAYVLFNYKTTTNNLSLLTSNRNLVTSSTKYILPAAEIDGGAINQSGGLTPAILIPSMSKSVITLRNPGYLFLQIANGNLPVSSSYLEAYYSYRGNVGNNIDEFFLNNININTGYIKGTTARHLYNIIRDQFNQYGAVYAAKYHYIKHVMVDALAVSPIIECFNGDTFITKFSVMNSNITKIGQSHKMELKGLTYIWVESSINCGLRHYTAAVGKEGDKDYVQGTLPYYPKQKLLSTTTTGALGVFNYSSSLGHPTGYNKQYSFENTIRTYSPRSISIETISNFPNRLIYSEKAVDGEQLDSFRILLPNNFHDIPKEKGKLTNLFTLLNTLYAHTERSLWKTYFNETAALTTTVGEVYLGNGGIFNRPSTEVINVKGGYAGTTSRSGFTTPFGHFFVDNIQKKVFMFSDQLTEISDQGMFKFFKDNVSTDLDTPALGVGYVSSYDYANKRWLFTKIGAWTISYSVQLKSWSSFHDYLPYHYISNGDRLFSASTNVLYENNIGNHGVYYGNQPANLQLDIVLNDVPQETKTFDNLVFYTTSNKNDREDHFNTFSTLHCYSNTRNTGKCRLVVPKDFEDEFINLNTFEVLCKLKSNEFRVAIPNDLVLDVDNDIFATTNLDNSRSYRPRMSGKYMVASLAYNNLRDNKFVLHNIGRIFRQRIR